MTSLFRQNVGAASRVLISENRRRLFDENRWGEFKVEISETLTLNR